MANREQLKLLRAGVEGWNKWREEEPLTKIKLVGAKLRGANLKEAKLVSADLKGADLSFTDLSSARLEGANLSGADLSGASLFEASLVETNLSGANLSGASLFDAFIFGTNLSKTNLSKVIFNDESVFLHPNFSEANLIKVKLNGARLSSANFKEANLEGADFSKADLSKSNFCGANLRGANLSDTNLTKANLSSADLSKADLSGADLRGADVCKAKLCGADLSKADFSDADIGSADLSGADLLHTNLVRTKIDKANISNSSIYGVNVWDLDGEFDDQKGLIITPKGESTITVDNIKVAQFIYLLLNNKELRDVLNTLTSKTVLILGRFAIPERKAILDALRNKLREYDLLPIVFDFDRPTDKDFTETIKTLAGISYFVIADVTNPKSSPLELQATVPDYQIPFVPIIQEGESPFAMMADLQQKYSWVLPTKSYDSIETLMKALKPGIIDPAVEMRNKLRLVKAQEQVTESLRDYMDKTL